MATVTSLTADRILELMAGWESVAGDQSRIDAILATLREALLSNSVSLTELLENVIPALDEQVSSGAIEVSNLKDTILPTLESKLDRNERELEDLNTVTLPALRQDLDSEIVNRQEMPRTIYSDTPPEDDPEDPFRYGDVWHDTSDEEKRRSMWNGTEWSMFTVDIPDLSLTVRKFNTSTHMIY